MRLSVLILSLTIIFLKCPAYTGAQFDEAMKAFIKLIVEDLYGSAKSWLLNYLPSLSFWSTTSKCPDSAVKYLRDPPHNWFIAPREKDVEDLKKLFESINNSDNKVSVVHVLGVPGSGKTELARQFGNSVYCERNGSSTVVTLNAESPKEFRESLITSIWEIMKSDGKEFNTETHDKIEFLANKLKHLLKKRPGWLLIVDNIRDPNITQKNMYKQLPTPGTDTWGTGKMLVTTQVPLTFGYDEHIRVKHNKGLTLEDATNFLCKLVEQKTKRFCDTKVSEEIVKELEYFPLSILAASDHISRNMNLSRLYSWRDYLTEHAAATKILPAHDYLNNKFGYRHSMLSALRLTIKKTREVYLDVFCDFIALTGFTTVNQGYISSAHVKEYLQTRGHKINANVLVLDFPLVYLSQEKFHIHQVVSFAFRQELEESETDEKLQYILRDISYFFANQYSKSDNHYEILNHFSALVQNLPTRCPNFSSCLIAPEWKNEYVEAVSILIFKTYWRAANNYMALNCSKLDTFLLQLSSSPNYNNRLAVHIRFTGYQALYNCLKRVHKANGSFLGANAAIQLIKEVAPELSDLHTVPVSLFLLQLDLFIGKILYNDISDFILLSRYLTAPESRQKLCSSLCHVTNILIPQHEKKVRKFCIPDLNISTALWNINASGSDTCVDPSYFVLRFKLMLDYHIPLGRSYPLEHYLGRIRPYGACYERENVWKLTSTMSRSYTNNDRYDALGEISKIVEIASREYHADLFFFKNCRRIQVRTNREDNNTTCPAN